MVNIIFTKKKKNNEVRCVQKTIAYDLSECSFLLHAK